MLPPDLRQLQPSHLIALLDNSVPESRELEYKEALPGNGDADRKEFLADVSAFANGAGGFILYGAKERRDGSGKPTGQLQEVPGVPASNLDAEVRRLENIIRDGIAPRLPGVEFAEVGGFPLGSVLVIRIPKSWAAPHMVSFAGTSKFFARNNAGKYQLDVGEIRSAFAMSASAGERIRAFRGERLSRILDGDTPHALPPGPRTVLHLIPLASLDPAAQIAVSGLDRYRGDLKPIYASGWNHRYNFEGFSTNAPTPREGISSSYVQCLRNGAIEAVDSGIIYEREGGKKYIPSNVFEQELIEASRRYLDVQRKIGVTTPIILLISLLQVHGYTMAVNQRRFWAGFDSHAIDRRDLMLPDILVEDFDAKVETVLRPAFDALWQATGWDSSRGYDNDGNWTGN